MLYYSVQWSVLIGPIGCLYWWSTVLRLDRVAPMHVIAISWTGVDLWHRSETLRRNLPQTRTHIIRRAERRPFYGHVRNHYTVLHDISSLQARSPPPLPGRKPRLDRSIKASTENSQPTIFKTYKNLQIKPDFRSSLKFVFARTSPVTRTLHFVKICEWKNGKFVKFEFSIYG